MDNKRKRTSFDLAGQRFGNLTAIEPTQEKKNGYVVWRCKCDCGNESMVPSRYLKNGWRTDCGCSGSGTRYRDLTGRRFGKLVVDSVAWENLPDGTRREARAENGRVLWDCSCDCGGKIRAVGTQLLSGYRKSCGCLSRPPLKDWNGKRFGKLTVTGYEGKRSGSHLWRCICDCGNETVVSQSNLKSGHTMSCGCLSDNPNVNLHILEGTCVEIIRSKKIYSTNTSGVRGVYRAGKTGKWAAQIVFQGKKKYLGCFDTVAEAAAARREAEQVYEEFLEQYEAGAFKGRDEETKRKPGFPKTRAADKMIPKKRKATTRGSYESAGPAADHTLVAAAK